LPLAQAQEFYYISVWSQFGIKQTSLSLPEGIAVDPSTGNVYVADTANNRIQVFSRDGTFLSKWGRYGSITNGTLRSPTGIAVDQAGTVYVADTDNNRIQVFSRDGTFIKWGTYGPQKGSFNHPEGIAVDPSTGNVYVADTANNRIQVFSSNGTFLFGIGKYGESEEGLRSPSGIAVDPSTGNVYVADTANNRIQLLSKSTITTLKPAPMPSNNRSRF
jgi:DNA-binding beta-propeller fold protein YncE